MLDFIGNILVNIIAGIITIIILLIIPGLVAIFNFNVPQVPRSGEISGQILSIQKTGIFVKSNEAKIQKGGFSNGSGNVGEAINLTIPDNLLDISITELKAQNTVIIEFDCPAIVNRYTTNTGCFVTSLQEKI